MEILGYNMPEDLYYDEHHFWFRKEGDELVVGMNDFALQRSSPANGSAQCTALLTAR